MDIADPKLEEYAEQHTTPPEPLLRQLAEETRATLECPQMLTGTIEGRFLDLLVNGLAARRVLNYYDAVLPRLSDHGLIAADNTLWSGRVVHANDNDESTRAIREFNSHVAADERVIAVMRTIRDGVTLIRRR